MSTIISLTSIPTRINKIGPVIESLKTQTAKIDQIILWLPRKYRRSEFNSSTIKELPKGLEVRFCDVDYGPATKVLPAIEAFKNENVNIIYCDDDEIYSRDWAQSLLDASNTFPETAITVTGLSVKNIEREYFTSSFQYKLYNLFTFDLFRRSYNFLRKSVPKIVGEVDICQGFSGVLVRPNFFDRAVFKIPDILWTVDDIWLSGNLAVQGVKRRSISTTKLCRYAEISEIDDLTSYTYKSVDRARADFMCLEYFRRKYGIWKE